MIHQYPIGVTGLDPDEAAGLIPNHIRTIQELNEWEENNILEAEKWSLARRRKDILNISFIKRLHQKMFNQTWQWAGDFRRSNKSIGVDWPLINIELGILLEEARYQIENQVYEIKEIVVRLHHKLVWIHCFANGNGRHARLMADIVLFNLGENTFKWGRSKLYAPGLIREQYLIALRKADNHDYEALMNFVNQS